MGGLLAQLVAFAIIGIMFTFIAFLFGLAKRSLFGGSKSVDEKRQLEEFKTSFPLPNQAEKITQDTDHEKQLAARLEAFKNQHPTQGGSI